MPVPKDKEKLYGKVVGKNINEGKSMEQAKQIADKAVSSPKVSTRKKGKSK